MVPSMQLPLSVQLTVFGAMHTIWFVSAQGRGLHKRILIAGATAALALSACDKTPNAISNDPKVAYAEQKRCFMAASIYTFWLIPNRLAKIKREGGQIPEDGRVPESDKMMAYGFELRKSLIATGAKLGMNEKAVVADLQKSMGEEGARDSYAARFVDAYDENSIDPPLSAFGLGEIKHCNLSAVVPDPD